MKNYTIKNVTKKNKTRKKYNKNKYIFVLPITKIIKYMFSECKNYNKDFQLNNYFMIDYKQCASGCNLHNVLQNSNMSIDKFITHAFYSTQPDIFKNKNNLNIIKNQISKDIKRSRIFINNVLFDGNYFLKFKNPIKEYYKLIIINMKNNINLDFLNKIALLSCQNILNYLTNMITIDILNLAPIISSKFYLNILINENEARVEINFKSSIVPIDLDGNIDVENENRGKLDFSIVFDLKKNNYKFNQLLIQYNNNLTKKFEKKNNINNTKYILPLAGITGSLVTTPFLLPLIGL